MLCHSDIQRTHFLYAERLSRLVYGDYADALLRTCVFYMPYKMWPLLVLMVFNYSSLLHSLLYISKKNPAATRQIIIPLFSIYV